MDGKVSEVIPSLIAAVETILNPSAPPDARQTAHQVRDTQFLNFQILHLMTIQPLLTIDTGDSR